MSDVDASQHEPEDPGSPNPDTPESESDTADDASELAGHPRRIGVYEIQGVLGEGGFGVVYEAQQREPIERRVALKLIRPGMDSETIVARFEAERQALALMSHPNIASVFEAGLTDEGQPFFVMELVRGEPITSYCDRERQSTSERLGLFLEVCSAIQHAHQKGIIHRDIKPSNILVHEQEGFPSVKIIDFGVAKALDRPLTSKSLFTSRGQLIGTPEYMSPEQADIGSVDIDTRSDIYSLGVVLYELLVGALPFDPESLRSAAFSEIQRIIREVDPPKPSTRLTSLGEASGELARKRHTDTGGLLRELRDDLDWITIKAMEKSRSRRYPSASEFALDIQRHLRHEPVLAGPPTIGYRTSKFFRRHRLGVTTAAVIMLALVVGVVGLSIGLLRALAAEELARERFEQAQRDARTRAAVVEFLSNDLLAKASPRETARDTTVRQILDEANASLDGQFADSPVVEATLRSTIGDTYRRLGHYDTALPHLRRAVFLFERELTRDDVQTLEAINKLGVALWARQEYDEAEQLYRESIDRLNRLVGPTDRLTLAARSALSVLLRMTDRHDEAESIQREVLDLRTQTLGPDDPATLTSKGNLAVILRHQGQLEEAESLAREVLEARERLLGQDHPATLTSAASLASLLIEDDRVVDAITLLDSALQASNRRLTPSDPLRIRLLTRLATAHTRNDDCERATPLWRELLGLRISREGPDAPDTVRTARSLANCIRLMDDLQGAIDALMFLYERIPGLPAGRPAQARAKLAGYLADLYDELGDGEQAAIWRARTAPPPLPPGD